MSPFYRPDRVSPSVLPVGPGVVIPVPGGPDRRDAIGAALSGISRELADPPWRWPVDRLPAYVLGSAGLDGVWLRRREWRDPVPGEAVPRHALVTTPRGTKVLTAFDA